MSSMPQYSYRTSKDKSYIFKDPTDFTGLPRLHSTTNLMAQAHFVNDHNSKL